MEPEVRKLVQNATVVGTMSARSFDFLCHPGEGAAKFEHVFPPFGVGDPRFISMRLHGTTVLPPSD